MAVTQTEHPWRATLRNLFAALLASASMWALIVEALGVEAHLQWVSGSILVTAGITRVMARPCLAAAPPAYEGKHRA
jgi:hypothetical protein